MKKFLLIFLIFILLLTNAFAESFITSNIIENDFIIKEPIPKQVIINSSSKPIMKEGEIVYLTSTLIGFDNCSTINYQWECDKGNGFKIIPEATNDTYFFFATVETLSWNWRLTVTYTEGD